MAAVVIYEQPRHPRSGAVCQAMEAGIRRVGDPVRRVSMTQYSKPVEAVAVFYGYTRQLKSVMHAYQADESRHAVYVDLGYFGRKQGGKFDGYHKVSVDARHPTAYFQRVAHGVARWQTLRQQIRPWRVAAPSAPIVLAGMGPKGAEAEGYGSGSWEMQAAREIRKHTKRRIIYRPKPNWPLASPVAGTEFTPPGSASLLDQVRGAWAIVSHHSNANVEALVNGIPSFTVAGIASPASSLDLTTIEHPRMPECREQWCSDLAWTQFSLAEMAVGTAWRHLKDEGLV